MEIKVLDLTIGDENKNVYQTSEEELFGVDEYTSKDDYDFEDDYKPLSGWDRYIDALNGSNLDNVNIDINAVDKDVFIIDDGGELLRLKDGSYLEVCLRGDYCRIWNEDDKERISYFNTKLGK